MRKDLLASALAIALTVSAVVLTGLSAGRAIVRRLPEPDSIVADWGTYSAEGEQAGAADAAVTIVVFTDYQCVICRDLDRTLEVLRRQSPTQIRLVWRHFPLMTHRFAAGAARACVCAAEQGRFRAMHDVLFYGQEVLGDVPWLGLAARAGVPDTIQFAACLTGRASELAVQRDREAGRRLGLDGAPGILVNDKLFRGLPPALDAIVRREVKRTHRATAPRGGSHSARLWLGIDVAGTGPDGAVRFGSADAATLLSDGTIVVADGLGASLRLISADGTLKRSVGRHGRGPGEFQWLTWLGQCGEDSLFVWDGMLLRGTVVDRAGAVVREFRLAGRPGMLACSRSGVLATLEIPSDLHPPDRMGRSPHFQAPLRLLDRQGVVLHELGDVPAMETRPLGKLTSIAMTDDRLFVGTNDSAFVDVYAMSGARTGGMRLGVEPRRAQRHHYERAIDAQVRPLADRADRRAMKRLLLEYPMPSHLPLHGRLLTDPDGGLWAVTSFPGDPVTTIRGLRRGGGLLLDLDIGRDVRVFEVGRDYVLAGYEEESGEPHVALYRFVRQD
jgi:protein-disulfide isomerase